MNTRLNSLGRSLPRVLLPGLCAAALLSGCAVYDPYYPAQPAYPVAQPVYAAPVYAAPAPVYVPPATFSLGIYSGPRWYGGHRYHGGHGGHGGHWRGGGGGGGHHRH